MPLSNSIVVSAADMKSELTRILEKFGFTSSKADKCAEIFTDSSVDGVYTHGVNRFAKFIEYVRKGYVNPHAEPSLKNKSGGLEQLDGNLGPGPLNAMISTERAMRLSIENGIGCVGLSNTNHWMRGGTYGWHAAKAGFIFIGFTNTIANMPAWGAVDSRIGNNPLVIAVPRHNGHIVLDMAMSQFSYGKLQENVLNKRQLPVPGGYDVDGNLTSDPASITKSLRPLPIGFWKGSGLSFVLDVLVTSLSNGLSVKEITSTEKEIGLSQIFICLYQNTYHEELIEQIIEFTKSSATDHPSNKIYYPGEKTLLARKKSDEEGVFVDKNIWDKILKM